MIVKPNNSASRYTESNGRASTSLTRQIRPACGQPLSNHWNNLTFAKLTNSQLLLNSVLTWRTRFYTILKKLFFSIERRANVSVKDAGSRVASVVRDPCGPTNRLRGVWQTRPLEPVNTVGAPVAPLFFSRLPEASHSKSYSESTWETSKNRPAKGREISFNSVIFSTLHRRLAGLYRCFLFLLYG